MNGVCGDLIGDDGDYSYGPFVINRALLPLVTNVRDEIGWGWRPFLFLAAHREGQRVCRIADDYPCPPEQADEDEGERIYRLHQLSQNLSGVVASAAQLNAGTLA